MTTIANGTITPARNAPRRRLRRAHPVIAAALVAVTVAAGCVGGASAWREHASARRLELARWQTLAGPAGDAQALAALRRAAAGKEAAAQTALGEALLARADAALRGEGVNWLRQAAGAGDARAHFLLGKAAFLGDGGGAGGTPDAAAAWQHFAFAAAAGNAGAAYYLGLLHRGGYGRTPDAAAAARWFAVAADAGVAQAMFMLANAYREGAGVPRDEGRAVAWYEAAAEREHPESIQALAMAYRYGELGLKRDEGSFLAHLGETAHALKHPALKP
ncbi:tetratricopeptide repeat protein [Cupriavidus sp.]|uniref:tetratricopeptide repeat protein n=1 Tax=Cupriavidus sp. TaxID=1873897 RepID=UPI003D0F2144